VPLHGRCRWTQALAVTEHGTPAEILDLAFRLYDLDGNGTIEMRELSEILRVRSAINPPVNLTDFTPNPPRCRIPTKCI